MISAMVFVFLSQSGKAVFSGGLQNCDFSGRVNELIPIFSNNILVQHSAVSTQQSAVGCMKLTAKC
jgi:hypothetical protein